MATDTEQLLREKSRAILTASSVVQTLCGRATRIVIERDTLALGTALPILTQDLPVFDEASGRAEFLYTAVAEGPNAGDKCRALLEAAKGALTQAAFSAAGLTGVAVFDGTRRSVTEVEDIRGLLDLESTTLTQADWSLPLLVLD